MTEVEKYRDPAREGSSIELAPAAWGLAQKIAGTEFVPAALRGKPEAVLACMLYGREAGVGEMNALSKIHVIDGRPGMAAELMRALVFQHGHEIWIEESSSSRCTVGGKRRDSTRETRVTWTIEDANRAGLKDRKNWRAYPDAMLLARATAKLCRAVFPDVLAGLSYTLEELQDGDVPEEVLDGPLVDQGSEEAAAPPPPKPTARARKAATRGSDAPAKTEPDPTPRKAAPAPPLPGEDEEPVDAEVVDEDDQGAEEGSDDDVVDAEVIEDDAFPPAEGPDEHLTGPSYSGPQVIAIRLGELGVKDRDHRLRIVSAILDLEETLESTKDLTNDEISKVLEDLRDDELAASFVAGTAEATPDPSRSAAKGNDGADTSETEGEEGTASSPPRRRRATPDPETWDADRWRAFLKDRKVKVSELVREANRLGREKGLEGIPGSLDDVPGSGLCADLVGYVEDLALERSGS